MLLKLVRRVWTSVSLNRALLPDYSELGEWFRGEMLLRNPLEVKKRPSQYLLFCMLFPYFNT